MRMCLYVSPQCSALLERGLDFFLQNCQLGKNIYRCHTGRWPIYMLKVFKERLLA